MIPSMANIVSVWFSNLRGKRNTYHYADTSRGYERIDVKVILNMDKNELIKLVYSTKNVDLPNSF